MDPTQWRCTSVAALGLGLPASLDGVAKALNLPEAQQKTFAGKNYIRQFAMPCKASQANGFRTRNLPQHDPDAWNKFKAYARQDVVTERAVAKKIAAYPLLEKEQKLWVLDQKMNSTGIAVDLTLVQAAIEADAIYKTKLMKEAMDITGLENPSSVAQLKTWFEQEYNLEIPTLTKAAVAELSEKITDAQALRVLALRGEVSKTSVAKFKAIREAVCPDGRVRGLLQFGGASRTGRWAGRLVQVQNLRSNSLPDLDNARELIRRKDFEAVELLYPSVPDVLSQLVRTAFVAPPGHRFIIADFSSIEARVIAWLADCRWRLDVFAGDGKIYERSAERMFNLQEGSVGKKSPYRQKGKIAELALGYGGGGGALKVMGALKMGLKESELEEIKTNWRDANSEIVNLWYAAERAFAYATNRKDKEYLKVGDKTAKKRLKIEFSYEDDFLFITLPSQRRLAYRNPSAEVDPKTSQIGKKTYHGVNQKTRSWEVLDTYGGKLVENIVQAIARDCLAEAMLALDEASYRLLITVHDEIVIEAPEKFGSLEEVLEIMSRPISWAPGLVLKADGFETPYYRKETG
jgi:DNA polymerase